MSLFDIFKMGKLKKFSGNHILDIDINHKDKDILLKVNFYYDSFNDSYDINLVAIDGKNDLWNELSDFNVRTIHHKINQITGEWRRSIGITSRRKNGNFPFIFK
jgi:hypothetical protein